MGLRNIFKKQLSTVIEWTDQNPAILFYKYPSLTNEIKNASKLIVAPGQGCIIVYEGKVTDVITEEGTYFLETDNHPFITTLLKLRQSFESEHKMGLYYFRTAEIVNQKWGTSSPVKYVDAHYKFPVELGAYGNYSVKLTKPQEMFANIVGSKDVFTAENLRSILVARIIPLLTTTLAKSSFSVLQIDANLTNLSDLMLDESKATFDELGLQLTDFRIEATSFNDETMERIGKVADMTSEALAAAEVGLDYVELEKLRALRDAARNEGGLAGAGLQVGAGFELSKSLMNKKEEMTAVDQSTDEVTQLKKLKLLLDEGILTQEEFDLKKKEILSRM